ncbi:hypothetical protein D9613_010431 [Agrocybe pediades]|uniref:Transmembrane protein n=1 Tax=Agrocybe pediades TaxID=84607 RepID=A0A8H4VHE7_9AGAR|nr:hypothetical protein D9613_010431 [Agrocybe pediades]KAF9567233.1 hypothetical protein CPC08DRAFT_43834 [Agrocybe pediades]
MATNGTIPALPNPFTPMAFLPPDLAFQVTISTYILIGSCGIMVWDILNNLPSDIRLLKDYRITYPTIVYFISRLGALGYVLASTIFETAPTGNCRVFEKVVDWLFPVAVPFTSLLFFFRVRAIFDNNKFVVAFFGFMWLAVLAGCLTVTQGVTGANIGTTNYCINASLEGYVSAAAIIPLVNDTLVFIAISWRLLMNSHLEANLKDGVRTLVFGVHMPAFSKSLLQDGQAYYLTTVTTSLMTVIMLYIKAVPVSYQTMFTVPNIMLMNIMACRVFRNTKFGIFRENTYSSARYKSTVKDDKFAVPLSLTSGGTAGRNGRQVRGQVSETTLGHDAVMKTVEYDSDSGKYGEYPPVTVGDHNV